MSGLHALRAAIALATLLLAFGCGSDSAAPPDENPIEGATLALAATTSVGRVGVQGLPAPTAKLEIGDIEVILSAASADEIRMILDHDAEGWYFIAPLHPVDPVQGGDFQVRITDGTNQSAAQPLQVDGLPAAPGAFASLVATMREHLEQRAGWMGTSIDELKATPREELSDEILLPLKLAQAYLDSDDDDHDLTDLADPEDLFLPAVQKDVLDRLFGYFDLEQLLRDQIEAQEPTKLQWERAGPAKGTCINQRIAIDSAPELSQRMIQSALAGFGADPNSDAGQILSRGGGVLTALSVAPSFVGATASVSVLALGAVQAAMGFVEGLLPTSFASIDFDIDKTEFNEDSTEFATISNVKVVAQSEGWSADSAIVTSLITAMGAYLSAGSQAQINANDFMRDIGNVGLGAGADAVFGETDIIEFCAQQWTVDISEAIYNTGTALQHRFEVAGTKVTPLEAGTDQLRVAAQPSQFGGREIHKDIDMEVKQIRVVMSPDEVIVEELGETVQLTATVLNADLPTLLWLPEAGSWDDGLGNETNDGRTRPLVTPLSADDYPFQVRVESLSRQGPRASGLPERVGWVTVRYRDTRGIVIDPYYDCIAPGETLQFEAVVSGFEEYTVVWEKLEGQGSISQSGLYTAVPIGVSFARIRAYLAEDEEVEAEARVDVSGCTCSFSVKLEGDANWTWGSSQIAYTVSNFGTLIYQFYIELQDDGSRGLSANIVGTEENPAPLPGQTGSWEANFVYVQGSESWVGSWDPDIPLPGVTVTISELTADHMIGRFTGNIFQFNDEGDISSIVGVDMPFRAALFANGSWPCE